MSKPDQIRNKTGPKTPEGRARALANLRPPWKRGDNPNPSGRPNAGASIKEWINQMSGWALDDIKSVANDDKSPASKVVAARAILNAASKRTTNTGAPICGPYFDRICDRTDGKPVATVEHTGKNGQPIQSESTMKVIVNVGEFANQFDEFAKQHVGGRLPQGDGIGQSVPQRN